MPEAIAVIITPRGKIFNLINIEKITPAYKKGTKHVVGINPENNQKTTYTGWCKIKQILASTK